MKFTTILIIGLLLVQLSTKSQIINAYYENLIEDCSYDTVLNYLEEFENLGVKELGTEELENTLFWLESKYQSYGYSDIKRDTFTFAGNTLCNLIVTKKGSLFPNTYLIVCGHYDTKNGPGVNDNGSGTAAILETARLLEPLTSKYSVKFINFSAEEDGLIGSSHYVENVANPANMDILLVFNIDAIGGLAGQNNSKIVCEQDESYPNSSNDESAAYTDTLASMVEFYSDLQAEISYAYASDYMPFQENEYVITGFYNYIESPYYHTPQDLLVNVDVEYIYQTTKAAIGASLYFSKVYDPSVQLAENKNLDFDIYPNPIVTSATLNLSQFINDEIAIKVIDISGKEVFSDELLVKDSNYVLDFENHKAGFYLISIKSNKYLAVKKVIVNS